MNLFVSYCFNDANKWVKELAIPLIESFGFTVVTGQRMEGEVLIDGVDARLRRCTSCVAFATRRNLRQDATYETHPWVVGELTKARALGFKSIEIREEGVVIGGEQEAYVHLKYREEARDRLLTDLAIKLAEWRTKRVRVDLVPPDETQREFKGYVARGGVKCIYRFQRPDGEILGNGEAIIQAVTAGFFVDVELPPGDVLVQFEVRKANNNGAWMSLGDGLVAIPVELTDA